jgi:hypothetical protein
VRRTTLAALLLFTAAGTPLRGQDIGEELSALTGPNAQAYIGPLARGLGHALTAGFVSSADPHGSLGFSIGLRVVGGMFDDDDKTFNVVAPASITYTNPNPIIGTRTYTNPYSVSNGGVSSTVVGDGPVVVLSPQGQFRNDLLLAGQIPGTFNIEFPDGQNLPVAPFAVIDAALGLGFGTQIMVRVVPTGEWAKLVGVDEVGELSAFGFGIMHNLTQWLPIPTPMWDVSLTAGNQRVNAGDYMEAKGTTFGLVASAGVGPLSAYAHASKYSADVDVDYTIENTSNNPGLPANGLNIKFTEELESTQRLAIGAQLNLLLLRLSAEYGMGDMKTLSGRVAFGLR